VRELHENTDRAQPAADIHQDLGILPASGLDLIDAPAPSDPLHGLLARLPTACGCSSELAVIGPGKAMHAASLRCADCEKHRGWVSQATHKSLTETINQFGRPTEPVILRHPPPVPPAVG